MIKIEKLTKKQIVFLNIIWHLDNDEQFQNWANSLPKKDREIAYCLLYLIQLEMQEKTNLTKYENEAKSVISSIMAK